MRLRILVALLIGVTAACRGQVSSTIALHDANSSLALPTMAAKDGVLYVAYRSFNLLRYSSELQVAAYDLTSHKELQHVVIAVPKVHGERASDGLALSKDGQTLAYVEAHEPYLVVLLATKDLSEIRRSNTLPFSDRDHRRLFAGFDGEQLCLASNYYQYGKPEVNGLRFIRLDVSDLKLASDTKAQGVVQTTSEPVVWLPSKKTTWLYLHPLGSDGWAEYTESGQKTGQEFTHHNALGEGAVAIGESRLLAFFGKYADGSVVAYNDHQTTELKLQCVPHPYGTSPNPAYAGAICTTQRDILPEAGGDKIVTSEFLLLKAEGPTVVWRQKMDWVDVGYVSDSHGNDEGFQKGDPLIYRSGSKLLIVAPSKAPALTVYEIDAPQ
jgi:hypothetical protein